jgi:hypothetical protein
VVYGYVVTVHLNQDYMHPIHALRLGGSQLARTNLISIFNFV